MNHLPPGSLRHAIWGLLLISAAAKAVPDSWIIEGAHGELHIEGYFTEGACRLDMTSEMQQISLGATPSSLLQHAGDRGQPTLFTLKLRDCIRSGGDILNSRSGNMSWDSMEPVVDITFMASPNEENPELVRVKGVSGMGLRLTDSSHRMLRLGERVAPQFVQTHSDELLFYVQPERTSMPLTAGNWQATVRFRLNYD